MNDDAKFFFFLCGFIGFVSFFCLSFVLYQDFCKSLFLSSLGCVFFALIGRQMLRYALSNSSSLDNASKLEHTSESADLSRNNRPSGEEIAAVTNLEAVTNSKAI